MPKTGLRSVRQTCEVKLRQAIGVIRQALCHSSFLLLAFSLVACSPAIREQADDTYGVVQDGDITISAVSTKHLKEPNRRASVPFSGPERPGTIVVDPHAKFLFFVEGAGRATRYPIAVGREGRGFRGRATIGRTATWPGWTPTANMLRSEPEILWPVRQRHSRRKSKPSRRARALPLQRWPRHVFQDPRYERSGNDRQLGKCWMHPSVQSRHHSPCRPNSGWNPGRRQDLRAVGRCGGAGDSQPRYGNATKNRRSGRNLCGGGCGSGTAKGCRPIRAPHYRCVGFMPRDDRDRCIKCSPQNDMGQCGEICDEGPGSLWFKPVPRSVGAARSAMARGRHSPPFKIDTESRLGR